MYVAMVIVMLNVVVVTSMNVPFHFFGPNYVFFLHEKSIFMTFLSNLL